ncbi:arginase family protein [Streptomyces sp. NPDC056437]|uniref:arginase family protein n=1 Tax=Streptomyces sp. NPDC056437 TaxID=3345816 RepID=UPI0036A920EE
MAVGVGEPGNQDRAGDIDNNGALRPQNGPDGGDGAAFDEQVAADRTPRAVRVDRFVRMGRRDRLPTPERPEPTAVQGGRSYGMGEIVTRGLDACVTEAIAIALDDCDGVFLAVDINVVGPGTVTDTGGPEPDSMTSRQLLDAVRRLTCELPIVGMDVVESSPPYQADTTGLLGNRVVLEALSGIASRRGDAWLPARSLLAGCGSLA